MHFTANEQKVIDRANRIIERKLIKEGQTFTSPAAVRQYLRTKISHLQFEVFFVIFLTSQNQVIAMEEMFRGTIDGAAVYPREVVKAALFHNAAAVIFAHNHPSQFPEPSQADLRITNRLQQALELVDVRVLDHLITGKEIVSFAERGLL